MKSITFSVSKCSIWHWQPSDKLGQLSADRIKRINNFPMANSLITWRNQAKAWTKVFLWSSACLVYIYWPVFFISIEIMTKEKEEKRKVSFPKWFPQFADLCILEQEVLLIDCKFNQFHEDNSICVEIIVVSSIKHLIEFSIVFLKWRKFAIIIGLYLYAQLLYWVNISLWLSDLSNWFLVKIGF